jgi:hypothetical protein
MEVRSTLCKLLLLLGTITLLVISSLVVVCACTRRTAQNAEAMLVDLQALHLNASLEDAQRFLDTHAGVKEVKCTDSERTNCELLIRLDNRWLARLRLAAPTDFAVGFTCSRGRVFRTGASVGVHRLIPGTLRNAYAAEVTEELSDPELGGEPFPNSHKLVKNTQGVFVPWFVNQRLDERATERQRKLAYSSLNLSCLYKLGGCKDAEALAPAAWTAADKAGWHDETSTQESH